MHPNESCVHYLEWVVLSEIFGAAVRRFLDEHLTFRSFSVPHDEDDKSLPK